MEPTAGLASRSPSPVSGSRAADLGLAVDGSVLSSMPRSASISPPSLDGISGGGMGPAGACSVSPGPSPRSSRSSSVRPSPPAQSVLAAVRLVAVHITKVRPIIHALGRLSPVPGVGGAAGVRSFSRSPLFHLASSGTPTTRRPHRLRLLPAGLHLRRNCFVRPNPDCHNAHLHSDPSRCH